MWARGNPALIPSLPHILLYLLLFEYIYSFIRHWSATRQTTSSTCSHRSPTYQHACRCAPPATATSFFTDGVAIRKPRVLCRCTPCVESVADRTETHAVVDNNIQASSKDNSVQLSTLLPLTTDYRMRHRTNCRRRTTNAAVTVTDIISSFIKKLTNATIIQIRKK